jgi:septal ring factor EnvC (AmiA/AmiB activator)
MWWEDIEAWRQQHAQAVQALDDIQDALAGLRQALDSHTEEIQRIEHSLHDHERGLAAFVHEGNGAEVQEPMMKNHRQQIFRHACQREAHERIKRHHHTVMAHILTLKTTTDQAM